MKPQHRCPCGALCPPSAPGPGRARRYCSESCKAAWETERRNDRISAATHALRFVDLTCSECPATYLPPARGRVPDRCPRCRNRRRHLTHHPAEAA